MLSFADNDESSVRKLYNGSPRKAVSVPGSGRLLPVGTSGSLRRKPMDTPERALRATDNALLATFRAVGTVSFHDMLGMTHYSTGKLEKLFCCDLMLLSQ